MDSWENAVTSTKVSACAFSSRGSTFDDGSDSPSPSFETAESGAMIPMVASAAGSALALLSQLGSLEGMEKPFSNRIVLVERARLSGISHIEGAQKALSALSVGDELRLVREERNMRDRWSIKVLTPANQHVGYVPCDCNEILARLMDGGKRLFAKISRILLDRRVPVVEMEVILDD